MVGTYCGHDHINTFMGDYYGIELGYGPGTGFGAYSLNHGSADTHTLRDARIFELDESTTSGCVPPLEPSSPRIWAST